MQHAASTDAFNAMLSASISHNIALHTGTHRVCVCHRVCQRVAVIKCNEAFKQIQLVAEHGRYVAGVLATGDCAVFARGCDSERTSARQAAPTLLSRP